MLRPKVRRVLLLLPTILFGAAFCLGSSPGTSLLFIFSVILHECGHTAAMVLLGAGRPTLTGEQGGFLLSPARPLSPKEEAIAAAAGPLANLLASLLALPLSPLGNGWFFALATVNALTALCNLLPIAGTDGGRLFLMAATRLFGARAGTVLSEGVSLLLCAGAFFGSVFFFYHGMAGLSLPLFAAASLFRTTAPKPPVPKGGKTRIWKHSKDFCKKNRLFHG